MKTLLTVLVAGLLCTASFATPLVVHDDSTHTLINNAYQTKTRSFGVGIFPRKDGMVMNMLVENYFVRHIDITIQNAKGIVFYTTSIGRRQRQCWLKFNMATMPDDTYLFVVDNGKDKVVKEFTLTTKKSQPVEEYRLITML